MKALSINGLTKTYGNGFKALRGLDLQVEEGDFFALLGPNGAGKTTMIGIVTSLVSKSSGRVEVFGHDIDRELEVAKSCIGLVPQEINFNLFDRVQNIVINQAGYYGIPRARAAERAEYYLRQLKLWDKRNERARTLSGGMKRRLMIARALVHDPRLLILDEPTAGVDIEIRRSMWKFLREINDAGTTIILTTHYLEEAETLCRNIAIIDGGQIIARDRMSNILRKLHVETFVLNLAEPQASQAHEALSAFDTRIVDETTIEIDLFQDQGHSLNDVFAALAAGDIRVPSMRNKVNRLEELFLRLVDGGSAAAGANAAAPAAGKARGGDGASPTPAASDA
jgi:ABC-2 type transport system ATP-binding protein